MPAVTLGSPKKKLTNTAPGKTANQAKQPVSNGFNKMDNMAKQPTSNTRAKDNRSMTVGLKTDKPKAPFNSSESAAYRGPNRGTSQAKPFNASVASAAPAQSTSTFSGSKGSTKPPVVSPGTQTKRGAVTTAQAPSPAPAAAKAPTAPRQKVQSRYQRDDLAMNSRRK